MPVVCSCSAFGSSQALLQVLNLDDIDVKCDMIQLEIPSPNSPYIAFWLEVTVALNLSATDNS